MKYQLQCYFRMQKHSSQSGCVQDLQKFVYTHFLFYFSHELIAHKSFHRYVVRAKQGTAQSVSDGRGSAAKSAGASVRRLRNFGMILKIYHQQLMTDKNELQDKFKQKYFLLIKIQSSRSKMY